MIYRKNRYWDPLYGRSELSEFEESLLRTPEIQRLRYIRMCNINSMLVTGASEISRFEHSLGVLRLAKEWIEANGLTDVEARDFVAAALLHDFLTGPFGHSFQYILEDNRAGGFLHDDIHHGYKSQFHQAFQAKESFAGYPFKSQNVLGSRWPIVADIVKGKGSLGLLISGSMDLDNIDNVVRLAFHVGITDEDIGDIAIRLVRSLHPSNSGLSIPDSSVPLIETWQLLRHKLYNLLLLDWAEFSAKGMLTKALELAVGAKLVTEEHWILTDDELLEFLVENATGEHQDISELVRRVRVGDLYQPLLLVRSSATSKYEHLAKLEAKQELEATLSARLRSITKSAAKLFVHYILDKKKTDRAVHVTVTPQNRKITIGTDSNSLLVGVFLSKPISSQFQDAVSNAIYSVLHEHGIAELTPIDDPMGNRSPAAATPQLRLL